MKLKTSKPERPRKKSRKLLVGTLESKIPARREFSEYRRFVQEHYDGLPGALLSFTGIVTGHEVLAGKLLGPRGFDVRGCKSILDAGCGNGRYTRFLLRSADADSSITACDYSVQMLHRARKRLAKARATHVAADLTRLPYADASFDAVVCGWVLEHLPDPKPGLRELARVLQAGGKLLMMVTEDTVQGAVCSRLWHCRTYNRKDMMRDCQECGLELHRELWFSRVHTFLRLGGIIVELRRV